MEKTITCPNCQGQKSEHIEGNTYRCLYCGQTFQVVDPEINHPGGAQTNNNQAGRQGGRYERRRVSDRSKATAAILAFFLGGLGIHRFYLGESGKGVVYLLFCWTGIPAIVALIDFVLLLTMSGDEFDYKYNYI